MRYPLEIELQPSKFAHLLNAAIHSIAAFSLLRSSLPFLLALSALVWVLISLRVALRGERAKAGRRILLDADGALEFGAHEAGGRVVYARPEASCVDFGVVVWLHWRGAHVRRTRRHALRGALMIFRDNVSDADWRALRIWLRHKAAGQVAEESEPAGLELPRRRT